MPDEESAEPDDVFDALADDACREIVESLDSPMTANEISDACDIPLSTTYRKANMLEEATLVDEEVELDSEGRHTSRYAVNFEEVTTYLDDYHSIDLRLSRPETHDERLENMWRQMGARHNATHRHDDRDDNRARDIATVILVLGALVTYYAYKAYSRTGAPGLRALALGFAFVAAGSLVGGGLHFGGVDVLLAVVSDSFLMAVGFALILYSLYADE